MEPYTAPSVGQLDKMDSNYDQLVKRVCKTESIIQTLKVNLLRAQTERDMSQKEQVGFTFFIQ